MKTSALQFTRQHLQEAKDYNHGNIAEYLLLTAKSEENGYFAYLTDEEIDEFEHDSKRREELENEVETFIKQNFDFDFEEFEY